MDSLYGGKQGVSFVLKAAFTSFDAMVAAFKQGPNYTNVWYGEYCILDTPNKNDKDNGKIYRRGLAYQNSVGGAEYCGQIVGPSSGTPYFQMNTIKEVTDKSTIDLDEYEYRRYPTGYTTDAEGHVTGYETSDGTDGKPIASFPFSKAHDTSLVPGKYTENGIVQYRDEIKWTWCNIRKDNADADSWFYVGFEIPYTITDYSIHQVSPYDINGNILTDATEIDRVDDETHPFYAHWDLGLPKGIKGDTLRNLRVIVPTDANRTNIYASTAITVDSTTGETKLGNAGYAGIDDDIQSGRQIIVFDYYVYDKKLNPTPIMIYLGDFNIITDINVADDGTLTVEYTHDDDTVFTKKIRWVNAVALTNGTGAAGGHITFTFNNDNPSATNEFDISWIKGIEIDDDGSLIYTFAGRENILTLPENANKVSDGVYRVEDFLQWIKAVSLDTEDGTFTVTNNRDQVIFETVLDWIKNITLDDNGDLKFYHTKDGQVDQYHIKWVDTVTLNSTTGLFRMDFNDSTFYESQLDWIDDMVINEENGQIQIHHVKDDEFETLDARLKLVVRAAASADGILTFYTNTGETIQLVREGSEEAFKLKTVDNVTLSTGLYGDKRIQIKYNTETTATPIGDPINYIYDMVVRTSDWHLLVLYNDPTHRVTSGDELNADGADANGVKWFNNIRGNKVEPALDLYWRDMGAIKDQAGILVGFNLDWSTVQAASFDPNIAGTATDSEGNPGSGVCGYLQSVLPSGLTGSENSSYGIGTKDKLVAYTPPPQEGTDADKQDKEFYAYDYNTYTWFYLGKIADSGMRDAKLLATSAVNAESLKALNTQGLLFRYANTTYSDTAITRYWDPTVTRAY